MLLDATFIVNIVDFAFLEDFTTLNGPLFDAFAARTRTLRCPSGQPSESAIISASEPNPRRTGQVVAAEIGHSLSIVFPHAKLYLFHMTIANVRAASISGRPSVPSVSDLRQLDAALFDHILPIDIRRMQLPYR